MSGALRQMTARKRAAGGGGGLFSDDFTGTNGAGWDAGKWEAQAVSGSGTSTIQSNRGRMVASSGHGWTRRQSKMASETDIDITGVLHFNSTQEQYPAVAVRGSGAFTGDGGATYADSYSFIWKVTLGGAVNARIDRFSGGSRTTLTNVSASLNTGTATAQGFRIQVEGSALRFRIWDDAGAEPGSWTTTTTDSAHASGGMSLYLYSGHDVPTTVDWDDLLVEAL